MAEVQIEDHCRAAVAFVNACKGTPLWVAQSETQAKSVCAMLSKVRLTSRVVPEVLTQLMKGEWLETDRGALIAAVDAASKSIAPVNQPKPLGQKQDFTSFVHFLSESQWASFRDDGLDAVELIMSYLGALGCRNPSEPTCRAITAAVCMSTESWDKLQIMPSELYRPLYTRIKASVKRMKGEAPFQHLPPRPEILKALHPGFYDALYPGDHQPVKSPFPLHQEQFVLSQIRCRGGSPPTAALRLTQQSNQDMSSAAGMQGMVNMVMQGMQQMAESQRLMMQSIQCGGGGMGRVEAAGQQRAGLLQLDVLPPSVPPRLLLPGVPARLALESASASTDTSPKALVGTSAPPDPLAAPPGEPDLETPAGEPALEMPLLETEDQAVAASSPESAKRGDSASEGGASPTKRQRMSGSAAMDNVLTALKARKQSKDDADACAQHEQRAATPKALQRERKR